MRRALFQLGGALLLTALPGLAPASPALLALLVIALLVGLDRIADA